MSLGATFDHLPMGSQTEFPKQHCVSLYISCKSTCTIPNPYSTIRHTDLCSTLIAGVDTTARFSKYLTARHQFYLNNVDVGHRENACVCREMILYENLHRHPFRQFRVTAGGASISDPAVFLM